MRQALQNKQRLCDKLSKTNHHQDIQISASTHERDGVQVGAGRVVHPISTRATRGATFPQNASLCTHKQETRKNTLPLRKQKGAGGTDSSRGVTVLRTHEGVEANAGQNSCAAHCEACRHIVGMFNVMRGSFAEA